MRDLVRDKFQQSILFHWSWTAGKVEKLKYSKETGECALAAGNLGKGEGVWRRGRACVRDEEQIIDHSPSFISACALRHVVSQGQL